MGFTGRLIPMKQLLRSSIVNCTRLEFIRGFAKGALIEGIKDIIAVASGKGGVGKSTTAVNLAVALANKCQLKVGLLDADIYGPSIPTMMKVNGRPEVSEDMKMIPIENHGVRCMSMGFLVGKDAPIVWRGALIVSTPQDIALIDARRGANMFQKVEVPILGLIENMSHFKCPHCGEQSYIFGNGGARKTADEMNLEFLGEIPLEGEIRRSSDEGSPIVISAPDSAVSKAYNDVANKVVHRLAELAKLRGDGPEISL